MNSVTVKEVLSTMSVIEDLLSETEAMCNIETHTLIELGLFRNTLMTINLKITGLSKLPLEPCNLDRLSELSNVYGKHLERYISVFVKSMKLSMEIPVMNKSSAQNKTVYTNGHMAVLTTFTLVEDILSNTERYCTMKEPTPAGLKGLFVELSNAHSYLDGLNNTSLVGSAIVRLGVLNKIYMKHVARYNEQVNELLSLNVHHTSNKEMALEDEVEALQSAVNGFMNTYVRHARSNVPYTCKLPSITSSDIEYFSDRCKITIIFDNLTLEQNILLSDTVGDTVTYTLPVLGESYASLDELIATRFSNQINCHPWDESCGCPSELQSFEDEIVPLVKSIIALKK